MLTSVKQMEKLTFYFSGHNFEYECRNALRIFDLNIDYEVKNFDENSNNNGLSIVSILEEESNGNIKSKAYLYFNDKLLYESEFSSSEILMESNNLLRLKKTLVIKTIHNVLKNHYKVKTDYGVLTGVRVVKILIVAKKNGKTNQEINDILSKTYEVDESKIKLLWDILGVEEKYINEEENLKNYNLYIGIPFCPTKCSYCSFISFVNCKEDKINDYINTLIYEIENTIELALTKGLILNTIYIGGGTPSVLSEENINKIFNAIKKYYDLSKIKEITFEAGRPDTITEEKLLCLKENNVNRISINPQTMNEQTLCEIGRKHTIDDIINTYEIARKIGFDSINMDVILGLPGENEEDVKNTIEKIIELRPENITVHALAYKKNSELSRESLEKSKDYDLLKNMNEIVIEKCDKTGYKPYYMYRQKNIKGNLENIGFTLPNKESIYNMIIIEELESILACGLGASSKIKIEGSKHVPIRNFKSIEEYISRISEIIEKKRISLN